MRSSHLPALDGIRFIAVFLVILYHSGVSYVPGGHGVMLFFVLSGFLITWLMLKENEKTGTISLKGFYTRRVLRIFPAFYAYAFFTIFILFSLKKEIPWMHVFSAFFYFSNYYGAFNPELNNAFSHTWSLAVEEQFYLLFPFLFLVFCKNLKKLTIAIVSLIGIATIWRCVLVFGLNTTEGYIYSAFETRVDQLLIGCLLAIILKKKQLVNFWQIILKSEWMPFATLALLCFSIYFTQMNSAYKDTIGFTIEPLLMAIFITQAMTFSSKIAWKWLEYEPIRFLGMLSYSLYLYQQLTTYTVMTKLAAFPFIVQVAATIFVTIGIAAMSYYLIEMPFLQLKTMPLAEVFYYNRLKFNAFFYRDNIAERDLAEFLNQQKRKAASNTVSETEQVGILK